MADPTWDDTAPAPAAPQQQPGQAPPAPPGAPTWEGTEDLQAKYGTTGQKILTGLEGVSSGLISKPLTNAAELSMGLTTPQDIRARQEANPVLSGGSEAAGFGLGAFLGTGEASALEHIGSAVAPAGEALTRLASLGALDAAGPLSRGASTISKIASAGIKTGAEMAALQSGDELSKTITQDPGQSIGTAALNIGLAGVIGGAGGAALGTVSPLWKASMEKIGVPKILDDAKAQYSFRQSLPSGDVPAEITDELGNRLNEVDNMRTQMGALKGKSLERAMPEVTEENTAKINAQIQNISEAMTQNIAKASDNAYLKGAVPKLTQDFQDFLEVATNPEASYADKFDAIDDLKRAQQKKANYNLTAEDSALGDFTKDTARDLRLKLEDPSVWGDAARVQQKVNAAIKSSIDAEKDAVGKFTQKSALEGGRVVDPNKVQTLVNQSLKGKAGLRADFIGDYLKQTDNLADTINKIHTDAGLDAPVRLTPAPALNHTLGTKASAGTTLGNWLYEKGLATAAGNTAGGAIGAGLGALIGHPAIGAVIGEKMLAPVLTSIAKPLLEGASNSEAFKASLNYAVDVLKGQRILATATKNLFRSGEVIAKDLMPNVESRMMLERSLAGMQDPQAALNVGGSIGHYLPGHATAAATTAATAQNLLQSLKPKQPPVRPMDKAPPPDKGAQAKYERQLDIAQQPLVALQHAKNGTLQAQDVQTLKTIYPQLYGKIVSKTLDELSTAKANGTHIPYHRMQSLSLLLGTPLDSTATQPVVASILGANGNLGTQPAPQKSPKVSQSTAKTQEKVNHMYATPAQSRLSGRTNE